MNLADLIIEKEKSLLRFEVRHSAVKLKKLLSAEFSEVGASGIYSDLDDILKSLPTERNWLCKTQDWEFKKLSDDIVQTIHKAYIVHVENEEGVFSRRTSIWRNENKQWKMVYHQGTKIPPFKLLDD